MIVLLMMTMSKLRKLTTFSGRLILQSLTIDLAFCLIANPMINVPIYLTQIHREFIYHCIPASFALIVVIHAGSWTGMALSVNRFFAIVAPFWSKKFQSQRYAIIVPICVLCVAIGCNIPPLYSAGLTHGRLQSGGCGWVHKDGATVSLIGTIGTYLPLGVMFVIYSILFVVVELTKVSNRRQSMAGGDLPQNRMLQRRLRITKALCLSFIWYCICTLPPAILVMFYAEWWNTEIRWLLCTKTAQVLAYAASPVFFFAVNGQYRIQLKKICLDRLVFLGLYPRRGTHRRHNATPQENMELNPVGCSREAL
ncbi:uncharacterized protein LOC129596037 [Paramacrobiotus metropolitanus]|uniref:uncharacterized protein LOC129596037 n=1 Tax=Paramacrobiotus metropolitanus TaxID=2943436 RepID=UPI002445DE6B|nr:uncharacterized protein LOC129596037 [Paramacrobiotus metropolitanus]